MACDKNPYLSLILLFIFLSFSHYGGGGNSLAFMTILISLLFVSVKKGDKGVDLVASLCKLYDTSEDDLRKTMEKTNNLIADILKIEPRFASECKSDNLENIDTG